MERVPPGLLSGRWSTRRLYDAFLPYRAMPWSGVSHAPRLAMAGITRRGQPFHLRSPRANDPQVLGHSARRGQPGPTPQCQQQGLCRERSREARARLCSVTLHGCVRAWTVQ